MVFHNTHSVSDECNEAQDGPDPRACGPVAVLGRARVRGCYVLFFDDDVSATGHRHCTASCGFSATSESSAALLVMGLFGRTGLQGPPTRVALLPRDM
jgi:hypothetical protein